MSDEIKCGNGLMWHIKEHQKQAQEDYDKMTDKEIWEMFTNQQQPKPHIVWASQEWIKLFNKAFKDLQNERI